ncbi:MAG: signal recognition particle receptor subunit alpha, partial [bacterium]
MSIKSSQKLRKGLFKTRKGLLEKVSAVFSNKQKIEETQLENLEEILIESDMGVETAFKIIEDVKEEYSHKTDKDSKDIIAILKEELINVFPS